MRTSGAVVLFDTLTEEHLEMVGRVICDMQQSEQKPQFVAGSSGVDYALVKHWRAAGIVSDPKRASRSRNAAPIASVDRTIILSGSCSPVTDRQIGWALEHGFAEVPIDTRKVRDPRQIDSEIGAVAKQIISLLDCGQSVIAHTSRGPSDSRIMASMQESNTALGTILGRILQNVLAVCPVRRVAVVGGDTAGQIARALGIEAVEMIGPLEPGAPLCVVRSQDNTVDGLEVTFKGGQVGYDDFFGTLLSGQCNHALIGATQ
jgi:uncharacterized protein YgbK (DUF1537 family)